MITAASASTSVVMSNSRKRWCELCEHGTATAVHQVAALIASASAISPGRYLRDGSA